MNKRSNTNLTPTEEAYRMIKTAQSCILGVCAFTLINLVLYFTGSDSVYLFSIFFPIVAAFNSYWGFMGLYDTVCIIVYAVVPLLIFAGLGLAAKKKPSAITALAVLYGIDTIYLLYFSFSGGFDSYFITFILFHVYIMAILIGGMRAAKKLKDYNDGENVTMEELESQVAETEAKRIDELRKSNIVLTYDDYFAKSNGANKTGMGLMALAFIVVMMASIFGSVFVILQFNLNDGLMALLMIGLIVAETVIYIVIANKRILLNNQKNIMYVIDQRGVLTAVSKIAAVKNTEFANLRVIEDYGSYYGVLYTNKKGKDKKTYIPKAYPGLDEALRRIGAMY